MPDVTQILSRIESGDPSAADQLLPLVYEELRVGRDQAGPGEAGADAPSHCPRARGVSLGDRPPNLDGSVGTPTQPATERERHRELPHRGNSLRDNAK